MDDWYELVVTMRAKLLGMGMVISACALLLQAGCGSRPSDSQTSGSDPAPSAAAEGQSQVAAPEGPAPAADTNALASDAEGGAAEFMKTSLGSPFVDADLALKESFNRALIAFQIGDYARALAELQDLGANTGLNAPQRKAVQLLLQQTRKAAPEIAASNALPSAMAQTEVKTYPPAAENEAPFSTADPAVRETFARAKAAYGIGNYAVAAAELKALLATPELNTQQKYEAQLLLDKTPQALPAASAGSVEKPAKQ